jgi:pimeloyl-ACP methyl ester carboxylesterase
MLHLSIVYGHTHHERQDMTDFMSAIPDARIPDEQIADLRERIDRTRRVPTPRRDDRERGLPGAVLDGILDRWADFDVRSWESRVRALPWASAGAGDREMRMLHQRADPSAPVVVLLHGWPDSVLRFERVLPLLTDLNVVVPALPGYPFAAAGDGMSAEAMAELIAPAVAELGYDRYVASAGDVGTTVAEVLAARHPDRVTALHLSNVSPQHTADPDRLTPEARSYLQTAAAWFATEGGYLGMQRSRPNTLAVGLADSPAGLAAWIVEKLDRWADTTDGLGSVWSDDDVLSWLSAYWFTGAIATSFSSYAEPSRLPDRIDTPTVVSVFPHDIRPAPRSYTELFVDVQDVVEHDRGGHFAAWERPEEYAADLRRAVHLGARGDR